VAPGRLRGGRGADDAVVLLRGGIDERGGRVAGADDVGAEHREHEQ